MTATEQTQTTSGTTTPMVSAQGVHKNFGALNVLKGITLDVAPGEVMCLVGPSGSGKSTFLRCINHLETIDGGQVHVRLRLPSYATPESVAVVAADTRAAVAALAWVHSVEVCGQYIRDERKRRAVDVCGIAHAQPV